VAEATQAVAVDESAFYAIGTTSIGKYDKSTGRPLVKWSGRDVAGVVHLNSGVVVKGLLYCAHSNYPDVPAASSIEIFDAATLTHVGSRSLGVRGGGSATSIDMLGEDWWVTFASYSGKGGTPGKGPQWTVLTRLDPAWQATAEYLFPDAVVERLGTRSISGGSWGADQLLYATGHDRGELYVLRIPKFGSVLELAGILPIAVEGQGIAWDRTEPGTLYAIVRSRSEVVAFAVDSIHSHGGTVP